MNHLLANYAPPTFSIDRADLRFDLKDRATVVHSRMVMTRTGTEQDLRLDGDGLKLRGIRLNGRPALHAVDAKGLTVFSLPDHFILEIETEIDPEANSALMGLYLSNGNFYTQCEAEGFRRITYFLDRPDVMALYTTTIVADKKRYPVLLSNGNLVATGSAGSGRHFAKWVDPYRKPCYLFALVAGKLEHIADEFTTRSGRRVDLRIYSEPGQGKKCRYALESLKRAMKWDEDRFGLSFDLDTYNIVAVSDFNMGAMENKGLNIFNSKYVLASDSTATDTDFENIEAVIGHEYFHNWTGNRVTCRDWFQLSLKEGLTVFRDQEFSADMGSRAVKRIRNVRALRASQFPEDAGPTAHPVRPESYIEISNFYTATVYMKGAEVIRMIHTLLGEEGFRLGLKEYFRRHDGQAVTCEDFVAAMEAANGRDLAQFRLWYSQAGTPEISVESIYDEKARTFTLTLRQSCPPTPGQLEKSPFLLPLEIALIGGDGREIPLRLASGETSSVLQLGKREEVYCFHEVNSRPVPSLNRGFSAPVKVVYPYTRDELAFLMGADADSFNRWEAGQRLVKIVLAELVDDARSGKELQLDPEYVSAYGKVLADRTLDPAFAAEMIQLPTENEIADLFMEIDPQAVHRVRRHVRQRLAESFEHEFAEILATSGGSIGQRSLRSQALGFFSLLPEGSERSLAEYRTAKNMTETLAALAALNSSDSGPRDEALADFYRNWQNDPLVLDKWFSLQATASFPGTLAKVEELAHHPAFDPRNPNKVRALIGSFAHANPYRFHTPEGYAFVAGWVLQLDRKNPQVASRLAMAFSRWKKYEPACREAMRNALESILASPQLSSDLYEIVSKCLA